MSLTANKARRRLVSLIGSVNENQVAIELVSDRGNAWLVSDDEYRSLKETVYLHSSSANSGRLLESLRELREAQDRRPNA